MANDKKNCVGCGTKSECKECHTPSSKSASEISNESSQKRNTKEYTEGTGKSSCGCE